MKSLYNQIARPTHSLVRYLPVLEQPMTTMQTEDEEILRLMEQMHAESKPIQMLNIFRGLPISYHALIDHIEMGYVHLKVHGYQAVAIALEKRTFVQGGLLPEPVRANPVAVSVASQEVTLNRFAYAKSPVGQRTTPRVQPKEPLKVEVRTSKGQISAMIADLSASGMGVFTFGTYIDYRLDLKRNDQVELCIHLPGGRTLCLPGAISNMKRERSTMLYRLGLETYPDPIAAAALSDYVANRSAEILQELETMYRTMCDAIA